MEFQSIFQYFCYIITLTKISNQKDEKLGDMKKWDGCYLLMYLTCAEWRIIIWIKSPISYKFQM
jgi:uncharacterized membrane protein